MLDPIPDTVLLVLPAVGAKDLVEERHAAMMGTAIEM